MAMTMITPRPIAGLLVTALGGTPKVDSAEWPNWYSHFDHNNILTTCSVGIAYLLSLSIAGSINQKM